MTARCFVDCRHGRDLEVREIRALAATLEVNSMRAALLVEDGHVEIRSINELLYYR
jgi:hypothetical protein